MAHPIPTITVRAWTDNDTSGHMPASSYVETFWLPILGPTATWLYRRLAALCVHHDEGVQLDVADLAAQLGVRPQVIEHTLPRLVRFNLVRPRGIARFDVRTRARRLGPGLVVMLPESLQALHEQFERDQHEHATSLEAVK
jgi:hypothetical protein